MKQGRDRSIIRIRTFYEDFARARGIETAPIPKVTKKKETVQGIADDILNTAALKKTDFVDDSTKHKDMLAPDIEVEVDIPAEEILAQTPVVPEKINKISTPPKNNLVAAGLDEDIRTVGKQHSRSVQTTEGAVYDASNNDFGEGTIITNKKRKKHRLIPSMFAAITSWFTTTATELTTPKEKSEHTVNKAESRIATITAAARASKHAPHSDHGVMIKRLTKTKKKTPAKAMTISKKKDAVVPQWGSSSDDIQAPEEQTSNLTKEPVHIPQTTEEVPDSKSEALSTPEQILEPEHVEETIPTVTQPVKKEEKKVSRKERTYQATPTPTSGVSIYIYIVVIVCASLLGIGTSIYWFMSATPTQEAIVIRIPSLFQTNEKVAVTLSQDSTATLSTILELSIATRETTQIYPVTIDATGTQIPADAQTTLAALALRAPGSFTRSVTDITFGSYNGTDSFILMEVTNFDTAFGGMLDWEPDMSEDLTPLFGDPVTQSYDPYSRSDTQIRSAFFRDTIIANKSARLLVDATDDERLIYAFVRPNLILITSNSATFNAVLPLVTQ